MGRAWAVQNITDPPDDAFFCVQPRCTCIMHTRFAARRSAFGMAMARAAAANSPPRVGRSVAFPQGQRGVMRWPHHVVIAALKRPNSAHFVRERQSAPSSACGGDCDSEGAPRLSGP